MITTTIMFVIAYLLGSLPSAIIVSKIMKLPDPRTQGSKNPGTTNVLRLSGKLPAIMVLVGDVLKGLISVLLAMLLGVKGIFLGSIALAAVLGHIFPIFFKFRGGKGVATAFGALTALSPIVSVAIIITWALVLVISRYVSLASVCTAILTPLYILFLANSAYLPPIVIMVGLIVWRHADNIKRLYAGEENKFRFRK